MSDARSSRHSVFAFWRWSPRGWLAFALITPVVYFLLIPPVLYATVWLAPKYYPTMEALAGPADWYAARCPPLEAVWTWEWMVIFGLFGAPR